MVQKGEKLLIKRGGMDALGNHVSDLRGLADGTARGERKWDCGVPCIKCLVWMGERTAGMARSAHGSGYGSQREKPR